MAHVLPILEDGFLRLSAAIYHRAAVQETLRAFKNAGAAQIAGAAGEVIAIDLRAIPPEGRERFACEFANFALHRTLQKRRR